AARSSGSSAATTARTGARASSASRNCSNAEVVTTNPGGTAIPARVSSPSDPPLPPTVGRSAMPTSLNQATAITPPPLQGRGSGGGGRPRTARHSPLPTLSPEGERAFSYQSPSCVLEHAL